MLGVQCHTLIVTKQNLTGEVTGSLLCIIAGIFDKPLLIGVTMTPKKVLAKQNLSVNITNLVSPWKFGSFHPHLATLGKIDIIS
jgi:hypothetical protein